VSASDMATGGRFEFNQDTFDYLCADLDGVPLSRAVAASSALPLVLSPITIKNYAPVNPLMASGCGEPQIERGAGLEASGVAATSRRMGELRSFRMLNRGAIARPFVHLLDGGLADNVNARGPADFSAQSGGVVRGTANHGYRNVRRVVFIVVNAETSVRAAEDSSADIPSTIRSAFALADIPINRNSDVALGQARALVSAWEAEVRDTHARGDYSIFAADAKFFFIEINFAAETDVALRERMMAIPTSLELPIDDVRLLRTFAARALKESPSFQQLLTSLAQ
jgi:NTE family protein